MPSSNKTTAVPSLLERHAGKAVSGLSAAIAGGVLVGSRMSPPDWAVILEGLDKVFTADLFISIATLEIALVALLLPRLLQEADVISGIKKTDEPGENRLLSFQELVRAQRRLLASFLFAMIGIVISFGLDGVLEYQPPELQTASTVSTLANLVGPWSDTVECASSGALLAASIAYLMLGVKTLFTTIKRAHESTET